MWSTRSFSLLEDVFVAVCDECGARASIKLLWLLGITRWHYVTMCMTSSFWIMAALRPPMSPTLTSCAWDWTSTAAWWVEGRLRGWEMLTYLSPTRVFQKVCCSMARCEGAEAEGEKKDTSGSSIPVAPSSLVLTVLTTWRPLELAVGCIFI